VEGRGGGERGKPPPPEIEIFDATFQLLPPMAITQDERYGKILGRGENNRNAASHLLAPRLLVTSMNKRISPHLHAPRLHASSLSLLPPYFSSLLRYSITSDEVGHLRGPAC